MHCFDKLKLDFDGTIIWYLTDALSVHIFVLTFACLQCSYIFSMFALNSLITHSSELPSLAETILISGVSANSGIWDSSGGHQGSIHGKS